MKRLADMPRTSGSFLTGTLFDFRNDRLGLQLRIYEECGDIGVFRLGPVSAVMISKAEYAQQILVEQADAFIKSPGLRKYTRPLLGTGLLTSDRDFHKKQRKLMSPAFQHRRIASYAEVMVDYTRRMEEHWSQGQVIDVNEEMMRLTLGIVGKTLFDADVGESDAAEVGEALEIAMRYTMSAVASVIHFPISWPTPGNRRLRAAINKLDAIIYRIIRERRASGADKGDVLSMLLLAKDEVDGSGMSDVEVRDESMTVFLAGHETTANALTWSLYLLSQHPEVYARLLDEADRELNGRMPRFEDLPALPYAMQVLKESMRLYPPAYLMGREAIRDVTVGEYMIPKGTICMVNIYAMHRRADVFIDPLRFDPSRFEGDAEKKLPRGAYIPFGAGPRICIGNHFALMEGQLILAALARRFKLSLVPDQTIELDPLITLRPKHGIRMVIEARSQAAGPVAGASTLSPLSAAI